MVHASMLDYVAGFSPRNCTFFVCSSISAPFVEADCILGLEMRILGFMKNRLNFYVSIVEPKKILLNRILISIYQK